MSIEGVATHDPRTAFLGAATWHGTLEEAEAILAVHPGLADGDIHTAAVLGDDAAVRRFIQRDPKSATALSAPYHANALVYLGLSKYLRLDKARESGFLRSAAALLDAGADPNSGFMTTGQYPEFETALYGAAGLAHNAPLTRLLVERGADPNDGEAVYHSPETYDNGAMKVLVETGRVIPEHLTLMLVRKHDWHDIAGAKYLLEHGASPNFERGRGWFPLHHAIARDNALEMFVLLLDHGADPMLVKDGRTGVAMAALAGRSDLLDLLRERGFSVELGGALRLIAACAMGEPAAVRRIAREEPGLVREVLADGGRLLARFSLTNNADGVRQLLDLGVPVDAPFEGDGYWDITRNSTALQVAAWLGHPAIVRLLLERGAAVDARDEKGRTPLALAVKACVDSYWTERRTPESVRALLDAGASVRGVLYPSGYPDVDALLASHGAARLPGAGT
jgi:ankyrin repeat protein